MPLFMLLPAMLWGCAEEKEDTGHSEPAQFDVRMANISTPGAIVTSTSEAVDAKFAPGILVIHDEGWRLFEPGKALLYAEMEGLVEDGMNAPLLEVLKDVPEVRIARSYAALDEDYSSIPMVPGDDATLTETAAPGMRITVVTMFGESNDVFAATPSQGIVLFDADGAPVYGSVGSQLQLYDAGTEVNEEPGLGENQPARQAAANTGADENGVVQAIDGTDSAGFSYPAASAMLEVDIREVTE